MENMVGGWFPKLYCTLLPCLGCFSWFLVSDRWATVGKTHQREPTLDVTVINPSALPPSLLIPDHRCRVYDNDQIL
ncbi:hypothetical protein HOY80DRAFT_992737 [Tuber brumale]|nr:hypothetical protein HOY80DRAFT_992737 [Tuber brumale]